MNKILIGQSDFKNIRTAQAYYVDKSLFVEEIINCPHESILLPRPRRFGKTLNLSLLKYFFEIRDNDESFLFDGLAIKESPVFQVHFAKYPVIFMTFKDIKHTSWEKCFDDIRYNISRLFISHMYLLDHHSLIESDCRIFEDIINMKANESIYANALKILSMHLKDYHKKGVIILIDEYDTPIHAGFQYGYYKNEVVPFMRNFLSGGFKDNSNLFKGVITGTLRVSKESIFTGLNNLGVYTLLKKRFNNCFGFLESEVERILNDFNFSDKFKTVLKWYDGYQFGSNTVFNPWSVMNYVASNEDKPEPFWLNTSSLEMIEEIVLGNSNNQKQALKKELIDLIQDKCIEKNIDDNIILEDLSKPGNDILWSFLLHSGYLKPVEMIEDEFENIYKLQIPNMEVKIAYRKLIQKWFSESVDLDELEIMLKALSNGNISLFERQLKFIALTIMSYYDFSGAPERVYHALVLGMLVGLSKDYIIRSNRESGYGRYDIIFQPKDKNKQGIIIEFKKIYKDEDPETVLNEALKQINEKKYDVELKAANVNDILKLAVAFTGKAVYLKKQ
jgi:hypothetical protein